ncbi:MAG: GNAT family N-acetyltransferase [Clostridia bacterium]|nr:GNAT family N-acetyltransferase [Clostridia bacterium]
MIIFKEDFRNVDTYLSLREQVGWIKLDINQAQKALDNSLAVITVFDGDKAVGMGRIVGDQSVISYIQDLIIIPEYQGKSIGSQLLNRLIAIVDDMTVPGTRMMLCLMCAKGREKFYMKHGFIARPTESLGPGMIQYIEK